MLSLLVFGPVEEASRIRIQFEDVLEVRPDAVHFPRVGVQIVLHGHVLPLHGRNMKDARHGIRHAVQVVHGEANLHSRLVAAHLLAGPARKHADEVGAPLRKDVLDGPVEPCPVGEQQHHRRNTPGHPDHSDGCAPAVIDHRFPGLTENVFQHKKSS